MSDELKALIDEGYELLRGDERDYDAAFRILTEAANQSSAEACRMLAEIYHEGLGRAVDLAAAMGYYRRAYDLDPSEVGEDFLHDFSEELLDAIKNESRRVAMRKDKVREFIISAAANYLSSLSESFSTLDIELEEKELSVELGGHYTSDLEELSTGQWDVWTPPYTANYRFIGYDLRLGDKANIKSREFDYSKWCGEVSRVSEKVSFVIPSAPIDAELCIELEHKIHCPYDFEDWRRKIRHPHISISCKGSLKIRDAALCVFTIEAGQEEVNTNGRLSKC
jgi:hypothetical protein